MRTIIYTLCLDFIMICCAVSIQAQNQLMLLSQEEAIQIALKQNLEIKAAKKSFEAEQARFWEEVSPEAPQLFMENAGMPKFGSVIRNYGERWTGLTQNFEFPLRWYHRGKAVSKEVQAAEMDYLNTKLDIIKKVREGYCRVLLYKKLVEYGDENLKLLKDFEEKANIKYTAGAASYIEVLRAQVEVAKAEGDLLTFENDYTVAESNLKFLLNLKDDISLQLSEELKYKPADIDIQSLQSIAMAQHPDIRSASLMYESKQSNLSSARWGFLPDFYVGLFRQDFGNKSKSWASQIGFNIPLWFMMDQKSQIKQAKFNTDQAETNMIFSKKSVAVNVDRAYKNLIAVEKRVKIYNENILKEAEEIYRIAYESYMEGQVGYIELLAAQHTLTDTRIEYITALYDFQVAYAALIRAVGGTLPN